MNPQVMAPTQSADSHQRVQELTLKQAVVRRLRESILDGTFKAGDRLRQEELASLYGVSRIPVREALHRLEAEGLVIVRPQRGAIVAQLNLDEIEEIYELRSLLEGAAIEIAISRIQTRGLAEIEAILSEMENIDLSSDEFDNARKWVDLNRDFHLKLYEASGKNHLLHLIDSYLQSTRRNIQLYLTRPSTIVEAESEHRAVYRAVCLRDVSQARLLTEQHIANSGSRLVAYLQEIGRAH